MARAHRSIRALAPLLALFAALLLSGCGEINDMLDAGKAEKKPAAPAAGTPDTGATSAQAKLDAYYKREPRKVAQDPNDPIVSCSIRGKRQYMRRSDCALRGGHE